VDQAAKLELLAGARALLFPIDWPEPFGLVMIEAMACGTPVVARPCGAVPEIVTHERTGLIASSSAWTGSTAVPAGARSRNGSARRG
jgi:glycosyltransferase involved in cell wall biosynthesis